ncbi:hypothetical protein [Hyphococcus sp.]|uniref:hypothetical protein n=1 Tax=Hyphococcus sp. TaxID=2038636 RepID=UPI0035C6BCF2
MKMTCAGMTMRGVLRMDGTFVSRLALCRSALFARVVLRRMMDVFFRRVRRRDDANRAP